MGKAEIVAMRGSAGITGRADTALTTKRKRGEETDIDRGDMRRKTISEVRDTDHGESKTAMANATSIAHGRVQTIRIVQMVEKGQNAIIPPTMNTTGDGTIASTNERMSSGITVEHTTARETTSVRDAIEGHVDNEASIATDRHLLTASGC